MTGTKPNQLVMLGRSGTRLRKIEHKRLTFECVQERPRRRYFGNRASMNKLMDDLGALAGTMIEEASRISLVRL